MSRLTHLFFSPEKMSIAVSARALFRSPVPVAALFRSPARRVSTADTVTVTVAEAQSKTAAAMRKIGWDAEDAALQAVRSLSHLTP